MLWAACLARGYWYHHQGEPAAGPAPARGGGRRAGLLDPSRRATANGSSSPGSPWPPTCNQACRRSCQRNSTRPDAGVDPGGAGFTCSGVARLQASSPPSTIARTRARSALLLGGAPREPPPPRPAPSRPCPSMDTEDLVRMNQRLKALEHNVPSAFWAKPGWRGRTGAGLGADARRDQAAEAGNLIEAISATGSTPGWAWRGQGGGRGRAQWPRATAGR